MRPENQECASILIRWTETQETILERSCGPYQGHLLHPVEAPYGLLCVGWGACKGVLWSHLQRELGKALADIPERQEIEVHSS